MNERLVVNHAALDDSATTLARAVSAVEARLAQLDHDLAPLHSEWFGQAQQAWVLAHARWSAAEVEMRQILADLGVRVSAARVAYAEADAAGARAFG